MPTKALTDRFVAGAKSATRITYFDSKTRGLALRLTPGGVKTWYFVYRIAGKPSQWDRLGEHSTSFGLADARKAASDRRRDVDHGIDVVGSRRAEAEAARLAVEEQARNAALAAAKAGATVRTFDDFIPIYLQFAKTTKRTAHEDAQKIAKHLQPVWGSLALRDITRSTVAALLDRLVADGMTVGVNRVQALISRMFTVALDRGYVDAHPAARMLKRFSETARERTLSDDELRALWTGLEAQSGRAADALRLRLLTAQRGEHEVCPMTWAEVDLEAKVWAIPGARTKNGRPHAVPLGPTAHALLTRRLAARGKDEPSVFPGLTVRTDDHRALRVLHGGAYEWKDLRRTVATRLGELGFSETVIGRVLNHARYTVTAKHYNQHEYLDEKRAALDAWDRELQRILANKPKARGRVVPMRRS
jgi:integrase